MTEKTITRAQLAEAIYNEVGLSHNESTDLLEAVLEIISDTLGRGKPVKISGFGSFSVRSKRQRMGRNPKTGVAVPVSARNVLVFRPSQILKAQINAGQSPSATIKTDGRQA